MSKMLKTRPLQQLLEQSLSLHVTSALLFTPSGNLMASAASTPDMKKNRSNHAALAANIWSNYERVAAQGMIEQSLPAASNEQPNQSTSSNGGKDSQKPTVSPLKTLTFELSDYNLHIQLVAPRILLCLVGPKQATTQPSSNSSVHSNEENPIFEGPGSFKSGVLGIRSGGATPAAGSTKGATATTGGASSVGVVSSGGGGGSLGILKTQAQALADYLEKELAGFEAPEGI